MTNCGYHLQFSSALRNLLPINSDFIPTYCFTKED